MRTHIRRNLLGTSAARRGAHELEARNLNRDRVIVGTELDVTSFSLEQQWLLRRAAEVAHGPAERIGGRIAAVIGLHAECVGNVKFVGHRVEDHLAQRLDGKERHQWLDLGSFIVPRVEQDTDGRFGTRRNLRFCSGRDASFKPGNKLNIPVVSTLGASDCGKSA